MRQTLKACVAEPGAQCASVHNRSVCDLQLGCPPKPCTYWSRAERCEHIRLLISPARSPPYHVHGTFQRVRLFSVACVVELLIGNCFYPPSAVCGKSLAAGAVFWTALRLLRDAGAAP